MLTYIFIIFITNGASSYEKSSVVNCLEHNNSCVDTCPDWMVQRHSDCTKTYWTAQKTCENPEEMLVGTICGFSRCDCPGTEVLDSETGYCYDIDNCPNKHTQ